VDALCGDASIARERLGWRPKVALAQLMGNMVDADLARYAGVAGNPR
jgi:GDPmannose 4,6-dehydratase